MRLQNPQPITDVCTDLSLLFSQGKRSDEHSHIAVLSSSSTHTAFPSPLLSSLTIFFNTEGFFSHVLLHWDGILPKGYFRGQGKRQIHNAMSWFNIQPFSNTVMLRILFGKGCSQPPSHTGRNLAGPAILRHKKVLRGLTLAAVERMPEHQERFLLTPSVSFYWTFELERLPRTAKLLGNGNAITLWSVLHLLIT